MKRYFTFLLTLAFFNSFGQYGLAPLKTRPILKLYDEGSYKPKGISYTSIGYLIPLNKKDIVIGGTTTNYKRFGFFFSYKVGIKNWMMPEYGKKGDVVYQNTSGVDTSSPYKLTGKSQEAVTFMLSGGLTFCIWKKMPMYVGGGFTRYRPWFEYYDWTDSSNKWNVNTKKIRYEPNFTAGFFLPLFGRLLVNVGYDSNPKSVFVGLCIRAKGAYDDIGEW